MDPVSLILAALVAGASAAAKDTATAAVKDAYTGLKELIKKKFAENEKAQRALQDYEEDPENYDKPLKKQLTEARIDEDGEIKKAAEAVMELVKESQGATGSQYNTTVGGDMKIGIQGNVSGGTINQTF